MKLGIVVNNLSGELAGYTSTHLALEAFLRGHEVSYIQLQTSPTIPTSKYTRLPGDRD